MKIKDVERSERQKEIYKTSELRYLNIIKKLYSMGFYQFDTNQIRFRTGTYNLPIISSEEIIGKKLTYKISFIFIEETQEIDRNYLQEKTQRKLKAYKFRQVQIFVRDAEKTGRLRKMKGKSLFSN